MWLLPHQVPCARAPRPNRADAEMCALHSAALHELLSFCKDAGGLETAKCNLNDGNQSIILLSFQKIRLSV